MIGSRKDNSRSGLKRSGLKRFSGWFLILGFLGSYLGMLPLSPPWVAEAQTSTLDQSSLFPVAEPFTGPNAPKWLLGGYPTTFKAYLTAASPPVPATAPDASGQGWLRLTNAQNNSAGYALFNSPFDSTYGIVAKFNYASYTPNNLTSAGADGISFFLLDGSVTNPTIGGVGGSLGYLPRTLSPTSDGLSGGYVGIALDEYGNFSIPCPPFTEPSTCNKAHSVTIHGSGSGKTGYTYLAHKQVSQPPFNTTLSKVAREAARKAEIIIVDSKITVKIDFGAGFKTIIDKYDLANATGQSSRPTTFKMGFSASTGGAINAHEIRNVSVQKPTDLALTKTGSPSTVSPGGDIQYTLVATNNGPNDVTDAIITDNLPASIQNVTWTCSATEGSSCGLTKGSGNALNLPAVSILQGGKVTLVVKGNVASSQNPGVAINSKATLNLPPNSKIADIDDSNDSALDLTTRTQGALLLDNNSIDDGATSTTVVGNLTETIDEITSPVYELSAGSGADNNSSFTISGSQLKVANTLLAAGMRDTYQIRVRVRDTANGKTFEQPFVILVRPKNAITTQPKPQSINSGETTTLSVGAVGSSLTYQWYKGNSGDTTTPLAGATASTYATSTPGTYWVKVKSGTIAMDSDAALVSLTEAPTIFTGKQPTDQTINSGQTATLLVQGKGKPTPTYQWYQGNSGDTSNPVAGETFATFVTTPLATNAKYWVQLKNKAGTVNSDAATVTVLQPPVLGPVDQLIDPEQAAPVTFNATMSGPSPLYQWYRGNKGDTSSPVGMGATLSLPASNITTNGTFWVRATNIYGALDSEPLTLRLHGFPTITTPPTNQTVNFGAKPTLTVAATGEASPTYQWYKVQPDGTEELLAGATSASFIPAVVPVDTTFRVKVTTTVNGATKTSSSDATVTVTPPTLTAPLAIKSGDTVTLNVNTSDPGPFTYQWFEVDANGNATLLSGATGASYTSLALTSVKEYKVRVTGPAGAVDVGPKKIMVSQPPVITKQPVATALAKDGSVALLSVEASPPSDSAGLAYQWYRQKDDGSGWDALSGATSPTFASNTPGNYKAVVTTAEGVNSVESQVAALTSYLNHPPLVQDDIAFADVNEMRGLAVLGNDSDPDGDPLSIVGVAKPAHGTAVIQGNLINYTPDLGFLGVDEFTYTISDGSATVQGKATVTVPNAGGNEIPQAFDYLKGITTKQDTLVQITNVQRDSLDPVLNPDKDTHIVAATSKPAHGKVQIAGALLSYTPDPGFVGTDTFTYTVTDGEDVSPKPGTIAVEVIHVNHPPVLHDDIASAGPGEARGLAVLGNDSDPDGDPLTLVAVSKPAHGKVEIKDGLIFYTSDPDFLGKDSFTYTVSDGSLAISGNITVNVPKKDENEIPQAFDYTSGLSIQQGETLIITNVQQDALDPKLNPDLDTHIVAALGKPAHGKVRIEGVLIYYTPDPSFVGTDTFTYTVTDGEEISPKPGTFAIKVLHLNRSPVIHDDIASAGPGEPRGLAVLGNDSDPDGDHLSLVAVSKPAHGVAEIKGDLIFYTSDPNFLGKDTFTYTVSDGTVKIQGSISVNVPKIDENEIPQALDHKDLETFQNVTLSISNVLQDALDVKLNADLDTHIVAALGQPKHGKVRAEGALIFYTPASDFMGTDSFTYTVTDGEEISPKPGTFTVNIRPAPKVNHEPILQDDIGFVKQGEKRGLAVLGNDSDPDGDSLSILTVSEPLHGKVEINANMIYYTPDPTYLGEDSFTYTVSDGSLVAFGKIKVTVEKTDRNQTPTAIDHVHKIFKGETLTITDVQQDALDPKLNPDMDSQMVAALGRPLHGKAWAVGAIIYYTPNPGFAGTDTFTYTVTDGEEVSPTPGTITIEVLQISRGPIVYDDIAFAAPNVPRGIAVLGNDIDPDQGSLFIVSVGKPAHGVTQIKGDLIFYTSAVGFLGTDTFTYTVGNGSLLALGKVTVTVPKLDLNETPRAFDYANLMAFQDATLLITNVLQDGLNPKLNPDMDTHIVATLGKPKHGKVRAEGASIYYTPDPGFVGTDTFTYTVTDGEETSPIPGIFSITVQSASGRTNHGPLVLDDIAFAAPQEPRGVAVLGNDSDPDGDPLTIVAVSKPLHGTVEVKGGLIFYTSAPNFLGKDSFTYTASDGSLIGLGTVTMTVPKLDENEIPQAFDRNVKVFQDRTNIITEVQKDALDLTLNPDMDTHTVATLGQPAHGKAQAFGALIHYTPNQGFIGTDTFTYTVTDGEEVSPKAGQFNLTVLKSKHPPLAKDDVAHVKRGKPRTLTVLGNDNDPDEEGLKLTAVGKPLYGTAKISEDLIHYTPNLAFLSQAKDLVLGTDVFTYTISNQFSSATASITVTIGDTVTKPEAFTYTVSTPKGKTVIITNVQESMLNPRLNPSGETHIVKDVGKPGHGKASAKGSLISYTPEATFEGTDTFTYTVTNGAETSDAAVIKVLVGSSSTEQKVSQDYKLYLPLIPLENSTPYRLYLALIVLDQTK